MKSKTDEEWLQKKASFEKMLFKIRNLSRILYNFIQLIEYPSYWIQGRIEKPKMNCRCIYSIDTSKKLYTIDSKLELLMIKLDFNI